MEDESFRWDLGASFLDQLRLALEPRPVPTDEWTTRLRSEQAAIVARRRPVLAPDTDDEVLVYTALLIAAWRGLPAFGVADDERVPLLALAQRRALAPITTFTREALDASDDPFLTLREVSRDREVGYFGSSFGFERPRDDGRAYHLHITGCAFVRLCGLEGAPELGPLLCEVDSGWIAAIDPERHRMRFDRPTTIALGGDRCRFLFTRT